MRALFLWGFLLIVVEFVVLYSMKMYAHSSEKEPLFLWLTLLGYVALGYLIIKILELQEYIGLFFVFRNILIAMMALGIGLFVFGEKMSKKQIFGVCLGIVSLFLIA
ncbi:small membrane protein [Cannes 8 virus]|uniref:putative small membrane protein n=1 Tax=Melbournevirus TaxID=1560514 RepID=UPI000392C88B|nr:putative small membrane protein [Melbournevirus]AGV01472.1 small membrane protein [Cannes 8 virus]AIT54718.1 membrane protein [Melbournevirus]